ncbi:glutamine amidotransferase-related protein [Marinomonas mediterranea]|jgi:GMP synthase - Glutamine amidotransferase domain|uniref:Glutamine amidotransferase class-I n=1 Tax=Marinomonas mediterranea (strain ATCC 700492 / JCM 21426 / NBRC 103028 / MMB-1) TaxID=717774 RepID=F2JWX3_MARM1|nr:gamma-glutamyl-gamma-aminobutyrate hydrolase family protein [Marinomonas mediterranea]ADZ92990.1 glutamine amidotransferase class-I [Marinomonas mediterranea MMB-1]WCN10903.1 glutamine amidotransferase [Marinomonas mediterranea]WCN14964.1 glutamine amidotransferase [Marinomonas mediterranea]WCN19009.1 glutamine amidotransferase [Marinomonas mediterranea MMB-1]
MKIGILAAGITPDSLLSEYPSYADMFAIQLGKIEPSLEFRTYDVRLDQFPESAKECDGWLITGSRSNVDEALPWMLQLADLVREIDQLKQPLAGICFGHQIIAYALGGHVEKFEGGWGVGIHSYAVTDDSVPGIPQGETLSICAFHQYQVTAIPANARVFARSDFCEYAGLIYEDRILTFQAHPEFSKVYESALLDLHGNALLPEDVTKEAYQSVESVAIDSPKIMVWIASFLHRAS